MLLVRWKVKKKSLENFPALCPIVFFIKKNLKACFIFFLNAFGVVETRL